eukprot:53302-Eustigmatos_ZCMA.PRE.1
MLPEHVDIEDRSCTYQGGLACRGSRWACGRRLRTEKGRTREFSANKAFRWLPEGATSTQTCRIGHM